MIGSISPARAFSVRSVQKRASASLPCPLGASAPEASPGWAGVEIASCPSSGEPAVSVANRSERSSAFSRASSGERLASTLRSPGVFSIPSSRCPVRMRRASIASEA